MADDIDARELLANVLDAEADENDRRYWVKSLEAMLLLPGALNMLVADVRARPLDPGLVSASDALMLATGCGARSVAKVIFDVFVVGGSGTGQKRSWTIITGPMTSIHVQATTVVAADDTVTFYDGDEIVAKMFRPIVGYFQQQQGFSSQASRPASIREAIGEFFKLNPNESKTTPEMCQLLSGRVTTKATDFDGTVSATLSNMVRRGQLARSRVGGYTAIDGIDATTGEK